jgi:hypothetical protein
VAGGGLRGVVRSISAQANYAVASLSTQYGLVRYLAANPDGARTSSDLEGGVPYAAPRIADLIEGPTSKIDRIDAYFND